MLSTARWSSPPARVLDSSAGVSRSSGARSRVSVRTICRSVCGVHRSSAKRSITGYRENFKLIAVRDKELVEVYTSPGPCSIAWAASGKAACVPVARTLVPEFLAIPNVWPHGRSTSPGRRPLAVPDLSCCCALVSMVRKAASGTQAEFASTANEAFKTWRGRLSG